MPSVSIGTPTVTRTVLQPRTFSVTCEACGGSPGPVTLSWYQGQTLVTSETPTPDGNGCVSLELSDTNFSDDEDNTAFECRADTTFAGLSASASVTKTMGREWNQHSLLLLMPNRDLSTAAECPASHPFAIKNGLSCCSLLYDLCAGAVTGSSTDTTCCNPHATNCPYGNGCINHKNVATRQSTVFPPKIVHF